MEQRIILCTVSDDRSDRKDGKYLETQQKIVEFFKNNTEFGVTDFYSLTFEMLVKTQFYLDNKTLLDSIDPAVNGRAYKPYAISEALKLINDGDFLIYNDCSPELWEHFFKLSKIDSATYNLNVIKNLCAKNGGILTAHVKWNHRTHVKNGEAGYHTHENFTTDRCIDMMKMQEYKYSLQHASGMIVLQKCEKCIKFVNEWLYWNLISDCCAWYHEDGETGKIGHRHDQSISGLLINQMNNRLVESLDFYQRVPGNHPYNFLNFCVNGFDYQFHNSNQPKGNIIHKIDKNGQIVIMPRADGKFLHLGCGNKHIDGFINIDARDDVGADEVDDVKLLTKYENNSVDIIYASHILEHITRIEYTSVLSRWYDTLKVGGTLRIAVPDIEQVFKHYQEHKDLRMLRGFLWGGQTYGFNYHYCGWDFNTLKEDLKNVGFRNIKRYDWKKTEHAHIDDFSQCYLPHMDKENGMLMSLNIEATK